MVVQVVNALDELEKELNDCILRCREWYGCHFPELGEIITDNLTFAKTVKIIGTRDNVSSCDLSDTLPEEIEEKVKEVAEISIGTEISDDDISNIQNLCNQVIDLSNYRNHLYDSLNEIMMAVAPNLAAIVGSLVGARLIAKAGSLTNLAKYPAFKIEILGAEKALGLEASQYGLIYQTPLISQTSVQNKRKMARMLAAKAALAARVDAFGEHRNFALGAEHKAKVETRLRTLEEGKSRKKSGIAKFKAKVEKSQGTTEVQQYSAASTLPSSSKQKQKKLKQKKIKVQRIKEKQTKMEHEIKKIVEVGGVEPAVQTAGKKKRRRRRRRRRKKKQFSQSEALEVDSSKKKKKKTE